MASVRVGIIETAAPSKAEAAMAQTSSRQLASHLRGSPPRSRLYFRANGEEKVVDVPRSALRLLVGALAEMGKGNAVVIAPIGAELTTNQAAVLLGMSRPYLIRLLDEGKIPCRKVGTHRRVLLQDLLSYKQRSQKDRLKAMELLEAQAQELEMGY